MLRSYRAELLKLRRPGTLVAGLLPVVLAALTTVLVFALAKPEAGRSPVEPTFTTSLDRLATAQGLTYGFSLGMSFIGLLVFVLAIANTAGEYSLGTVRSALIAQPDRRAWLTGRLLALLKLLVVSLGAALVAGMVTALVMAAIRGLDISAWISGAALLAAAGNFLNAVIGAAFFGLVGTMLATLCQSTVLALAIGIAWTFPLEHIIQNVWANATQAFPGLLFATVAVGGVPAAPYESALLAAAAYALVALAVTAISFTQRDVTA